MSRVLVLMIDDNDDDVELLARVSERAEGNFEFAFASDGAEGLAQLRRVESRVRLVLLDMKMPSRGGIDVLTEIRRDPALLHVPVVVFSSSDAPKDVRGSYRSGANAYVRKPVDLDGWRRFLARLEEFWTRTATLP